MISTTTSANGVDFAHNSVAELGPLIIIPFANTKDSLHELESDHPVCMVDICYRDPN